MRNFCSLYVLQDVIRSVISRKLAALASLSAGYGSEVLLPIIESYCKVIFDCNMCHSACQAKLAQAALGINLTAVFTVRLVPRLRSIPQGLVLSYE
jgi:hypothetical protein